MWMVIVDFILYAGLLFFAWGKVDTIVWWLCLALCVDAVHNSTEIFKLNTKIKFD